MALIDTIRADDADRRLDGITRRLGRMEKRLAELEKREAERESKNKPTPPAGPQKHSPQYAELGYEQAMRGDGEPIPHQYDIFDGEGVIATCWSKDRAAGIVRLCNSHDKLVAALEAAKTDNIRLRCALREMVEHCDKCGVISSPAFENAKRVAVNITDPRRGDEGAG